MQEKKETKERKNVFYIYSFMLQVFSQNKRLKAQMKG